MSVALPIQSNPSPSPLPSPIASSPLPQGSQYATEPPTDNQQVYGSLTRQNLIYIYSLLLALLFVLLVVLLFLLRTIIRRRWAQRQAMLAAMERQENNNPAHQSPRKKKHKHTKKPRLEDAWIGNGPLPASLSTEQLLDAIQPFSLAETKPAYPSDEKTPIANTTSVISAEVPTILSKAHPKNTLRHMLSFHRVESTSSCMEEDEKAEATPERPSSPPLYEIQRLRAGFLIAMPRPPPVPSSLRSRSTSNISVSASSRESDNDDWSLSDSKLNDSYLWDGELPELSVGISTICIPIPRSSPSPRP